MSGHCPSTVFHSPLFRSGTIVSSEGFRVTLRSRYTFEYQEDDLLVTANYDAATVDLDLLTESLSAWRGDRLLTLAPETTGRILCNMEAALTWKGYRVRLVASA